MTKSEIEHMWKVASNNPNFDSNWHDPVVEAFAELVAMAEREACAKVCDKYAGPFNAHRIGECADAIRARGAQKPSGDA
jgi:hypothetical protein